MEVRAFRDSDEAAVIELWKACRLVVPWNDPSLDIRRKLAVQREMFLVGCLNGNVIASVMAGYDGHRGWINYLAVHPSNRRSGYGKVMMDAAESLLLAADCPKINLQVRSSNVSVLEFYRAIGYKVDDVVSFGKRLIADRSTKTQNSPSAPGISEPPDSGE